MRGKITIHDEAVKTDSNYDIQSQEMARFHTLESKKGSLNFHSPEFNKTDDLHDSYAVCAFESLEGVITADMCHQQDRLMMQQEDRKPPLTRMDGTGDFIKEEINNEISYVTIVSQGRTLIIDTDPARAEHCREYLSNRQLSCTVMITGNAYADILTGADRHPLARRVDALSVTGAFCGFSAVANASGKQRHLTRWFDDHPETFDLVLDLQPIISFPGGRPSVGYFAPGQDKEMLDSALRQIPEMRGRFTKPKFISFRAQAFLHGGSRLRECNRYAEICPVGAIRSDKRKMLFNENLCQGCGACSLVCDMDAIDIFRP